MAEPILTESIDGVRVLRMQFGSANALSPSVVESLIGALESDRTPTVITGEGGTFSAGLDLVVLDDLDRDEMLEFLERFSVLMTQALTARYPLVAAVNGHAVAGGCVLSMACDYRIGVAGDYKIGMNEMALALTLPAIVAEILRGKLAPDAARDVMLIGALYDPDAAERIGLLDAVERDTEAAVARACELARKLGRSRSGFTAIKGALTGPIIERFRFSREAHDHRFIESWFGDESRALRRATVARLKDRT